MEDSAIVPDTRLRNEAGHASDMDSSPPAYEDASTALFSAKAKRSVKFIVSLNGSLTGPRDFVYYGTDLDAHVPALATNSIRLLCEESGDTPPGKDILTYPGNHQQIASVSGLHASIIEDRSPLLAAAFESSSSGQRLHLETLCSHTVMPFLRYLYTGSYSTTGEWEDVPTSVLLHCRMYHLGDLYDLLDLKSQAYVNVLRQCEYGCSSPEKPIDLCEAIEFAYKTLPGHDTISDAIVQYCVTRCLSHKLHEDADFRDLAFNVRAFHQDLTRVCRDRGYEDESSAIIIQLPYKHYAPDTYASTENPPISGFTDIIHHFHSSDRFDDDTLSKKRRQVTLGGEIASPKDKVRMHGLSNQTANVSPVTAPVETMPNIDKIELPIRESNISQIKQMLTAESLFGDHPSTSHQNFDWFPKLSTALPGPGFFGEDKAIEGQGHKYPLNVYDGENREDGLKRRSNEIAGLAHDVEGGKSQPILLPFREKHSRHSQLPFWQDRARHDAVDVTASRNAPSNGPMKCEPDSVTLAIESQVKRQKIESQPQKAYGPNHPWWRPQFAQPPSHYSQPMFQLSPTDAGRGEVSDHTSCMFIVGSQESDIPTVPRFTLSNGSPNPGAELSDVTPRTTRPSPTDFALAESVDRVKLPVASDLDRPRKLPTHFKTVSAPGHVPGSSLQPVVNSDRFDPEPSRARVTDMYRRGVVRQDLRRIQQSPAIKQVQPQDNIDHLTAGFPDVKRLDRQPAELRMHRERLADQGNNHACKSSCTQEPTKFAQTQAHGNESTIKPKSTADDHSDATPPIATKNVPAHVRNHALQDYQIQLMLLEQQNKKRAHMCRQDSDDLAPVRPQQRVAPRQTQLFGSNSPVRAAELSCDIKAAPVSAINNDSSSPTSDLPSTGPQNDPAVAFAENTDPTSNATNDLTKPCSDSEDVDMCDSDSDSDLSWVDVPLAAVDSAQQQAGPSKSPSTSGPIGARRPSSPSDSDWDFV